MAADALSNAMVLAAGLGTRLRPLTDELPKPAVPVLNRPLAAFTFDHLARHGVRNLGLNTHHLPMQLRAALEPEVPSGIASLFVHEPEILGTGGGIRHVWGALGEPDPFLVLNGDVLFEPDLVGALAHHMALGAVATMVLREVPDADRYGAVEIDAAGQVRRLLGLPTATGQALRKLMFTGVHILSARALGSLPERGCVVRQGYRSWLDAGQVVAGFVDANPWLELGTPADYANAQLGLIARRDAAGASDSLIHATSRVDAKANVVGSILGAGSHLEGAVKVERAIVWPGAHVTRDVRDAIVTTAGQVVTW